MANRWNERDHDWRGAQGWSENQGARGAFGEQRFSEDQSAGYNPAGPNQGYGGAQDRSYLSGGQNGPSHGYGQGEYGGQGGRIQQGYSQQSYGQQGGGYGPTAYGQGSYGQGGYGQSSEGYDRSSAGQRYGGSSQSGYGSPQGGYDQSRHAQTSQYGGQSYGGQGGQSAFGLHNPYLEQVTDGESQGHVAGLFQGKGPKGYKRSDERIREDISDRLSDDAHLDASEIEVDVKDGEVTLSGAVNDRQSKRRAEDCAERISGVSHVQNNLRVQSSQSSSTSRSADSGATTYGASSGSVTGKASGTA